MPAASSRPHKMVRSGALNRASARRTSLEGVAGASRPQRELRGPLRRLAGEVDVC